MVFIFYVFVLVCLFLVLFVSILENSFVLFCFCVVFVTRLSGLLVCILWSFFLFCFLLFVLNFVFFVFSFLSKKDPQKTRHSKNPKKQKCRKKTDQKKSVSAVAFTNSVPNFLGEGLKMQIFAYFLKGKWPQNAKKVESKLGPRLSQHLVRACCAT